MAYTLNEFGKLQNDPIVRGVVNTIADSPLFDLVPFETISGLAIPYKRTASLGGASFREFNGAYPESTPTFTEHVAVLRPLGGDSHLDRAYIEAQGNAVEDIVAATFLAKAAAVRGEYVKTLLFGDSATDTKEFDGLEKMGLVEVDAPETGFGTTTDTRQSMFDALDELLGAVAGGPNVLLMGNAAYRKLGSAGRREAALASVDSFGRPVTQYNGVTMVAAGFDGQGNEIIPGDDIYAIRFDGDTGVHGITANSLTAYSVGEMEAKPSIVVRVDWLCGAVMKHPHAAAVLRAADVTP